MGEKLIISNIIEGHDEYEFDLSKRIYMFSCLRDYKLCNLIIDWVDQLRRQYGDWSYDMEEGEKLTYDGGGDEVITTLDNSNGRLPYRKDRDYMDISLSNSYEVKYLGDGIISIEELVNGHKLDEGRLKKCLYPYGIYGNIKDKYLYFRNIESMKAPFDQMKQLDEIFKIVIDNPTCKVFLSTVSPYIAEYFNVNLLRYYEELGDKFSYYQFNDEIDEKTGRISIWKLNAVCNMQVHWISVILWKRYMMSIATKKKYTTKEII